MAARMSTIIIVLATFSVSYSLKITVNQQPTAPEDGTLRHIVAADEPHSLSGYCPEVESAFTRNVHMIAACERAYQEDTRTINMQQASWNDIIDDRETGYAQDIDKINKLQANLGIQQLTTADEIERRRKERNEIQSCIEELKKELNGRSARSCDEMEAAKDIQRNLIGKYAEMTYANLITIQDLNAHLNAHLSARLNAHLNDDRTAQNERQALVRSAFTRRNDMIDECEKGYAQDTDKINKFQAASGIQQLTAVDKLHRCTRIEDLKKEFNGRSKNSCEEMEAVKDLQDELIGMYGQMKFVSLATMEDLKEKAAGTGKAKKL